MQSLVEKLKSSALPRALVACLAVATLMPDSAQASDYCRQTSKSIGKEIAVGDASRSDRALASLIGSAVGVITGEVVCGPDERVVRAQEREQQRILKEQERMARAQQKAYEKAYAEAIREQARRDAQMGARISPRMQAELEQRAMQERILSRAGAGAPAYPQVSPVQAQPAARPGTALAAIARDMEEFNAGRPRRPGY